MAMVMAIQVQDSVARWDEERVNVRHLSHADIARSHAPLTTEARRRCASLDVVGQMLVESVKDTRIHWPVAATGRASCQLS